MHFSAAVLLARTAAVRRREREGEPGCSELVPVRPAAPPPDEWNLRRDARYLQDPARECGEAIRGGAQGKMWRVQGRSTVSKRALAERNRLDYSPRPAAAVERRRGADGGLRARGSRRGREVGAVEASATKSNEALDAASETRYNTRLPARRAATLIENRDRDQLGVRGELCDP